MKYISKRQIIFFRVAGIAYGLELLEVLFLRRIGHDHALTYTEYLKYMSNFIPFMSVYDLVTTPVISASIILSFLVNFVGNILLFIPWGFLLPIYFKKLRTLKPFIGTTLIALLLIESIQLFTMLGSFDIEDILLNTAGACIGFGLFKKFLFGRILT